MRAFILIVAAACLAVVIGCENQNNDRELAEAPASAPRVNLYPLTSPPPGSVQPLQGYAPTRITASQYGTEVPAPAGATGYYAATPGVTYGTGTAFVDPNAAQVTYATATYPTTTATATYQTAGFGVDAPFDATYAAAVLPNTTNPADPNYCPPGSEYCPVPGSAPLAAPVAPATTSTQPTVIYATAPAATTTTATYQTTSYTVPATTTYQTVDYAAPAYTTTTASYTPPVIPPAPVATPAPVTTYAPTPAPAYSAPPRLSATAAYTPPPAPAYRPPAYTPPPARSAPRPAFSSAYQRDMPVGLHFGEVEGTADIVGPLPSLDPIIVPAPGSYSSGYRAPVPAPAPNYSAPYVRPLSMNAETAPASDIYAMAAPAPLSAPATPTAAPAGRPMLLSSASRRPAIAAQQPVSAVAGVNAQAGDAGGYRLVPALDVPPGNHPNDFAPSQWFEVVRPGNGAVRIGRISATCVCVGARIPKRHYAAGERILVEARVLSKPSVNNVTYGLYVNILEPVETVVDADVTLRF